MPVARTWKCCQSVIIGPCLLVLAHVSNGTQWRIERRQAWRADKVRQESSLDGVGRLMDLSEQMWSLVEYDALADERIWSRVGALDDAKVRATTVAGVRSIGDTLAHMLLARVWWLSRWKGNEFSMPDVSTRDRLESAYRAVHDELVEFVDGVDAAG